MGIRDGASAILLPILTLNFSFLPNCSSTFSSSSLPYPVNTSIPPFKPAFWPAIRSVALSPIIHDADRSIGNISVAAKSIPGSEGKAALKAAKKALRQARQVKGSDRSDLKTALRERSAANQAKKEARKDRREQTTALQTARDNKVAAKIGNEAFLEPEIDIIPDIFLPPLTSSFCIF